MIFILFDEYGNKAFVVEMKKGRYVLTGVNNWEGRRWNFDSFELKVFMMNHRLSVGHQPNMFEFEDRNNERT